MAGLILAHIVDVMDRAWEWGAADCCTSASDVFHRLTGIDVMAPMRGRYSTKLGAARIIARHGGFLAMTKARAEACGLRELPEPYPGCIGVIERGSGISLGVCYAPRMWACKTLHGFTTYSDARLIWDA